jgi:hypothetical protein
MLEEASLIVGNTVTCKAFGLPNQTYDHIILHHEGAGKTEGQRDYVCIIVVCSCSDGEHVHCSPSVTDT